MLKLACLKLCQPSGTGLKTCLFAIFNSITCICESVTEILLLPHSFLYTILAFAVDICPAMGPFLSIACFCKNHTQRALSNLLYLNLLTMLFGSEAGFVSSAYSISRSHLCHE